MGKWCALFVGPWANPLDKYQCDLKRNVNFYSGLGNITLWAL